MEKHDLWLFNGPMVGDITPGSAKFWVRTAGTSEVQIEITGSELSSDIITTSAVDYFTAVLPVEGLEPFTEYRYTVTVDGAVIDKPAFQFRTAPEPSQKVVFDVNSGPGSRYVPSNEHAWSTMAKQRPLAYLGLGDNVYINVTEHRGGQRLFYYRHYLSPAYAELVAGTAIYAVWEQSGRTAMGNPARGLRRRTSEVETTAGGT